MASAGKVSPVVKGAWNSAVSYTRLDIVSNATNTRSYIARKDSINVPLENTEYWQILADVADTADKVNYDNTTSGLTATKVQAAIDELAGKKIDMDDEMSDTSTNAVQNKVIKKYVDDEDKKLDDKFSQLSGHNLLLNSDFRVNQRQGKYAPFGTNFYTDTTLTTIAGQLDANCKVIEEHGTYDIVANAGGVTGIVRASDVVDGYCNAGYTVDRWAKYTRGTIEVLSNGIKVNHEDIWQIIPRKEADDKLGKTYTLSCSIDGVIYTKTFTFPNAWDLSQEYTSVMHMDVPKGNIDVTFVKSIDVLQFPWLNSNDGESMVVNWVKIEQGSIATPYEHPIYSDELLSCGVPSDQNEFGYVGISEVEDISPYFTTEPDVSHISLNARKCGKIVTVEGNFRKDAITTSNVFVVNSKHKPASNPPGFTRIGMATCISQAITGRVMNYQLLYNHSNNRIYMQSGMNMALNENYDFHAMWICD